MRPRGGDRSRSANSAPQSDANDVASMFVDDDQPVSVAEAASFLGRDRTRVYALLRSGDLVAASEEDGGGPGPVRIERSSLKRWLVGGGDSERPLSPRNAWALIGLASGDQPLSERTLGLLEHPEGCCQVDAPTHNRWYR